MHCTFRGVYQAGTLSGNPLAMRAGIEMFKHLRQPDFTANYLLNLKSYLQAYKQQQMKRVFHLKLSKLAQCLALLY